MNIYTAPHVSGAPDWSAVPSAEIGNLLWTESCGVRAWAQLCWTEDALRLRLRGKGQITLRGLVRTIAPAKGKIWEEDASWQA